MLGWRLPLFVAGLAMVLLGILTLAQALPIMVP